MLSFAILAARHFPGRLPGTRRAFGLAELRRAGVRLGEWLPAKWRGGSGAKEKPRRTRRQAHCIVDGARLRGDERVLRRHRRAARWSTGLACPRSRWTVASASDSLVGPERAAATRWCSPPSGFSTRYRIPCPSRHQAPQVPGGERRSRQDRVHRGDRSEGRRRRRPLRRHRHDQSLTGGSRSAPGLR